MTAAEQYLEKCQRQLKEPWSLGFNDRGLGHGDYGILDSAREVVAAPLDGELCQHLIELHNNHIAENVTSADIAKCAEHADAEIVHSFAESGKRWWCSECRTELFHA